jgi:hypothetical protein
LGSIEASYRAADDVSRRQNPARRSRDFAVSLRRNRSTPSTIREAMSPVQVNGSVPGSGDRSADVAGGISADAARPMAGHDAGRKIAITSRQRSVRIARLLFQGEWELNFLLRVQLTRR